MWQWPKELRNKPSELWKLKWPGTKNASLWSYSEKWQGLSKGTLTTKNINGTSTSKNNSTAKTWHYRKTKAMQLARKESLSWEVKPWSENHQGRNLRARYTSLLILNDFDVVFHSFLKDFRKFSFSMSSTFKNHLLAGDFYFTLASFQILEIWNYF